MLRKWTSLAMIAALGTACSQPVDFALPTEDVNFGQNVWYNRNVDVIFVVDNSSGMEEHNLKLRNTIPTLVNALLGRGLDMHFAVITTSMGGSNPNGGKFLGSPKYLTSASPNLSQELINRLNSVGNDGSDLERGLDSLVKVLDPGYQQTVVPGFLRPDSLVAVIAMSSEDDKSSLVGGGSAGYMAELDRLVGQFQPQGRRWTMNFIGVLSLGGSCVSTPGSPAGYKEPGVRFMEMADESGGVKESICSGDLSVAASNLRRQIVDLVEVYRLGFKPVVASIQVVVNGVAIPRSTANGWDYLPDQEAIKFYGSAVPAPGADVRVSADRAEAN